MQCPNCGSPVRQGQQICGNCGLPVDRSELIDAPEEPEQEELQRTEETEQLYTPAPMPRTEEIFNPEAEGTAEDEPEIFAPDPSKGLPDEEYAGQDNVLPKGEADILEETLIREPGANEWAIRQMVAIPPGQYFVVQFGDLPVGARIVGHLREADGDIYDFHIVNEENYRALMDGGEAESLDEGSNATAYEIDVGIGFVGLYYLVITNRSISDPRDIHVDLRVSFP